MSTLREMVENLVNEKSEDAQIIFHGYLIEKLKHYTKSNSPYTNISNLDEIIKGSHNKNAIQKWKNILDENKYTTNWKSITNSKVLILIDNAKKLISDFNING